MMANASKEKKLLEHLFITGVNAVVGEKSVGHIFEQKKITPPAAILSIGKAAYQMYLGVPLKFRSDIPAFIVTKHGHVPNDLVCQSHIRILESSHPMPSQASLAAGAAIIGFLQRLEPETHLLLLVSGGASSLVEVLKSGISLADLMALTAKSLSDGSPIGVINQRRREISAIKGGGLLSYYIGQSVQVLAISDVEGDDINIIGSGIGARGSFNGRYSCEIIASNAIARNAIAKEASSRGLLVCDNREILYGDIEDVSAILSDIIDKGAAGIYIFGGEPVVRLPDNPGQGGRNQSLALLMAHKISGRSDIYCLVAGTDGTDGVTSAAGAIVDGNSFRRIAGADEALAAADAGTFLKKTGDQFTTGPTGTNVMDIVLVLKQ